MMIRDSRIIRPNKPRYIHRKKEVSSESTSSNLETTNPLAYDKLFSTKYIAWAAMIFSIVIWFKFGSSSSEHLGNTKNFYRILLVLAGGLLALNLLLKNSSQVIKTLNPPLLLLFLYGVAALLSSLLIPQNAFYTMWKSMEIIIDVIAMIGIIAATRSPAGPLTAYRWLMFYNALMLALVIIGALISPADALRPSRGAIPFFLQGYTPVLNPNTVGFISVQLVLHSIGSYYRASDSSHKLFAAMVFVISIVTLILAQSRTSTVGLVAGIIIYLYLDGKRHFAFALIATSSIIAIFTSFSDIITNYMLRGQSEELVTSLSGRTHGWEAAWDLFKQSPWTGHGFAAAARTEILGGQAASTLHGALFDVIVGVGLAGLIPWLLAIILMLLKMTKLTLTLSKWARTKYERSIHAELSAITAILVIRSATSSGTAMHEHAFMLMLCIIGYSYMMHKQISAKLSR